MFQMLIIVLISGFGIFLVVSRERGTVKIGQALKQNNLRVRTTIKSVCIVVEGNNPMAVTTLFVLNVLIVLC